MTLSQSSWARQFSEPVLFFALELTDPLATGLTPPADKASSGSHRFGMSMPKGLTLFSWSVLSCTVPHVPWGKRKRARASNNQEFPLRKLTCFPQMWTGSVAADASYAPFASVSFDQRWLPKEPINVCFHRSWLPNNLSTFRLIEVGCPTNLSTFDRIEVGCPRTC